jgi:sugar/nucleoside kinase (ribokinase family)
MPKRAKVVSLGVHIVDILGRTVEAIPEGQGALLIDEIRMTVAGTAAGTAIDLAKLGADVVAIGALGRDELGDFIVATMNGYGIDTSGLARRPGVQTSASMLPIRANGERAALHVVGANAEFQLSDIGWESIADADFLHLGGTFAMRQLDGEPAAEVLRFAKEHGVVTTMDVLGARGHRLFERLAPCLPYLDYFMPNLAEARLITGLDDPVAVAHFFVERGAGGAVIKMDSRGSLIATPEGELLVPAFKVTVVDTTGCGDAYCAGFIVGLSMGWAVPAAARLGTAAAALVAGGLGSDAGIVDLDQTIAFMEQGEPNQTADAMGEGVSAPSPSSDGPNLRPG